MELKEYLGILRARWWVVVACTFGLVALALAYSLIATPSYRASVKVLVAEQNTASALTGVALPEVSSQPERALLTQLELMRMRPIAESTIASLGIDVTTADLLSNVDIEGIAQTSIISITVVDEDPDMAADIANGLAQAYVDWSRESRRASIREAAEAVEARIEELNNTVQDEQCPILNEMAIDLRTSEVLEVGAGTIVEPAMVPTKASSPKLVRNIILGLILGLLAGIGLAFLIDNVDDRITTAEEAARIYGAPVLSRIPLDRAEEG